MGALTLRLPVQEQEGHQLVQKLASRPVGLPRGTTKHKKWQVGLLPAPSSSARHPLTIFSRRLPPFCLPSPRPPPLQVPPLPPSHRAFSAEDRPGTLARLWLRTSVIAFLGFFDQFPPFALLSSHLVPSFTSFCAAGFSALCVCGCVRTSLSTPADLVMQQTLTAYFSSFADSLFAFISSSPYFCICYLSSPTV